MPGSFMIQAPISRGLGGHGLHSLAYFATNVGKNQEGVQYFVDSL